jgi:hypothetical protein
VFPKRVAQTTHRWLRRLHGQMAAILPPRGRLALRLEGQNPHGCEEKKDIKEEGGVDENASMAVHSVS